MLDEFSHDFRLADIKMCKVDIETLSFEYDYSLVEPSVYGTKSTLEPKQ